MPPSQQLTPADAVRDFWHLTPQTNKLLGHPKLLMRASQPWNPNQEFSDEDRERGYSAMPCYSDWCGEDCLVCLGTGEARIPVPEYRPDKKIRATAWLPHGPVLILFWDDESLADFREKVRRSNPHMQTIRGWDYAEYDVRPSAVNIFQRNDPE